MNNIIRYWCPHCRNKTEAMVYDYLNSLYVDIQKPFLVDWCKNINTGRKLPYDICINSLKIIIEVDGPQHFGKQIMDWKQDHERDIYKMKCANLNGYSIIRIVQEDVWENKFDWKLDIESTINKIITNGLTCNKYICLNNEYSIFGI